MQKLSIAIFVLMCAFTCEATSVDRSPVNQAEFDMRVLDAAMEMFVHDIGRCPSATEGLKILEVPPSDAKRPTGYAEKGYLRHLPLDPWGSPYQYVCPGKVNKSSYDIWTWGADGRMGGADLNTDFGNWPGSFDKAKAAENRRELWILALYAMAFGFIVGLPIYITGVVLKKRGGSTITVSLMGFHLGTMVYLVLVSLLVMVFGPYMVGT